MATEYFTQNRIIEPVTDGQVISQHFILNSVEQNGTIYADNKEYTTLNGDPAQTSLSKLYNSEGYVTDLSNPQYYYYRRDHLGDNHEVWRANDKTTVQYTQYYPSGLPMASNVGDNPGLQERKYNGKEFVEMHGLDAYDYGARLLFSDRGGSWMSVDPLAEKFYDVSPYIYCHNNPINKIDKDGRSDEDSNGTPGKKPEFDPKTNKMVGHYTTAQSSTSRSPVIEKIRPFKMTMQQQVAAAKKNLPQETIKDATKEKYKSVVNDAMNDPIKKQCLTDPVMQTSASVVLGGVAGSVAKTGVAAIQIGGSAPFAFNAISNAHVAAGLAGVAKGVVKSYAGPDVEFGSSVFMNPISNFTLTGTSLFINALSVANKNPLPPMPNN